MSRSSLSTCEVRTTFPATLQAVEEFFDGFRLCSRAVMDEPNCFAVELLVREALTNAVVHGSHADPAKQVRCHLRLKGGCLLIAVADDGDGFDWRVAWNHAASFRNGSGRGLDILRKYANRVRYNERGNVVTIIKRI